MSASCFIAVRYSCVTVPVLCVYPLFTQPAPHLSLTVAQAVFVKAQSSTSVFWCPLQKRSASFEELSAEMLNGS